MCNSTRSWFKVSGARANVASVVAFVALTLAGGSVHAQTARSGGGASAQLLQQMQQLASERTALQAENAKLKKDLEAMRKERDTLKSGQQALDRRAKASEASLKSLQQGMATRRESSDQELAQYKEKMQQLVGKFRETAQTLRETESDRTTARQTLATRDQELKVCVDRNLALYKLNQEVLTRLEHQSVWGRVAQVEPFTKIKRVELENLVDEYKSRADDQRVKSGTPQPNSPSPPVAPTSATPEPIRPPPPVAPTPATPPATGSAPTSAAPPSPAPTAAAPAKTPP
jgi:chromosome segregation ATPase